jgi:hypothetical protein
MMKAAQSGGVRQPGEDPFQTNEEMFKMDDKKHKKPPGLENYSHEEILAMYEALA